MIEESIYKRYNPGIIPPPNAKENAMWFIFDNNKLFIQIINDKAIIPTTKDLLNFEIEYETYLGTMDGKHCYAGKLNDTLPFEMQFKELRSIIEFLEEGEFLLAGRASQILNWHDTHIFCGKCGAPTKDKEDERAKICQSCGNIIYPTICPAIIVAVENNDTILLAHGINFKNNMYSVLAGFVEPGETLEDCVIREVKEEVGIDVKNVKYFKSQSWPFPNSLMIGFTAQYAGGNIVVDNNEIKEAQWFSAHNLPKIPNNISISRSLIDQFINKHL